MYFITSVGAWLLFAITELLIHIFGWVRFLVWFLGRQWYVPKDKLAHTLELDMSIMQVPPGSLRPWYMGRQYDRRDKAERLEILNTLYIP